LQEAYRASVNMREQNLYQEYLTRLRSKDSELLHTPDGTVGPLERGFTSVTNPTDFKGLVIGFYGEHSDELAQLPKMLADAQVARWQGKYS
jgi:hypothetical protein